MPQQHNVTLSPDVIRKLAEYDKLVAENEALKARAHSAMSCKVGAKGGLSVSGLGRWPVTLYADQWERLIAFVPQIEAALVEHADLLSRKVA